ncbi:MAG TPA: hypothetical protein VJ622_16935 [Acidimicrobiia bacterium]|nr:hypothetical protein [Acidimicrobiia bacterium]
MLGVSDNQAHSVAPPSDEVLDRVAEVLRTAIFDQSRQAAPVIGDLAGDIDAAAKAVGGVVQDGGVDLQVRHRLTASPL